MKSTPERPLYTGRTEGNKRVLFPGSALVPVTEVHSLLGSNAEIFSPTESLSGETKVSLLSKGVFGNNSPVVEGGDTAVAALLQKMRGIHGFTPMEDVTGRYVVVRVLKADTTTLRGVAVGLSSIEDFPQFLQHTAVYPFLTGNVTYNFIILMSMP